MDVLLGAGSGLGISRLWVATIDVSSKREATFISLRDAEMAVKRKGFIVSLWMENKNFLQKLLKDDCIYWILEPVFEDKRVSSRPPDGQHKINWDPLIEAVLVCTHKS